MASGIKGGKANQERKATKKPTIGVILYERERDTYTLGNLHHERWKVREYGLFRLRMGRVCDFKFMELI